MPVPVQVPLLLPEWISARSAVSLVDLSVGSGDSRMRAVLVRSRVPVKWLLVSEVIRRDDTLLVPAEELRKRLGRIVAEPARVREETWIASERSEEPRPIETSPGPVIAAPMILQLM